MCDGKREDHEHKNDHTHDPKEAEELAKLVELMADCIGGVWSRAWTLDIRQVKQVIALLDSSPSPVDLFKNHEQMRECFYRLGLWLRWGKKASHRYYHAYVLRYSQEEGAYYTLWSQSDLSKIDDSRPWKSYDLFEGEDDE